MSNEEVDLLKTSILDSIEAYIDTIVQKLPFVKAEVGIISGKGTTKGNKVKIKGIEYDNISSIGNVIFSNNVVVYLFVPNNQYTNMFIMCEHPS